jgi:hypothetical protein
MDSVSYFWILDLDIQPDSSQAIRKSAHVSEIGKKYTAVRAVLDSSSSNRSSHL